MLNSTQTSRAEAPRIPEAGACQDHHFQMPAPAPMPAQASRPRPPRPARAESPDDERQPTADQVARSMAQALKFRDASPEQALRAQQIAEGRRMAQAEGFSPDRFQDERSAQIHAGKAAVAAERCAPRRQDGQEAQGGFDAPRKKKRSRSRNKGQAQGRPASAPAMH